MKKLFTFITALFLTANFTSFAADFKLTSVGTFDTSDKTYNEIWYTNANPTFRGTAVSGSEIAVKVGEQQSTVTADGEGNWSFTPSGLTSTDYAMSFTSSQGNISFTFHAGQDMSSQTSTSTQNATTANPVPVTGSNQMAAMALSISSMLFALYIFLHFRDTTLRGFERRIIEKID